MNIYLILLVEQLLLHVTIYEALSTNNSLIIIIKRFVIYY